MTNGLSISEDWERLDEGAAEERACFGAIGIQWDNRWLTECHDGFIRRVRAAPMLSGYHLAEWLAWNWWRLRWEPRSRAPDWAFAHSMASIGEGYVWPNITIFSDGERIALIAKPTSERAHTKFRYISELAAIITAREFENAVDEFVGQTILGQLREEEVLDTNLDRIWADVTRERQDPDLARRRRFEALLGLDADEADDATIERLTRDGAILGEPAMQELAAEHAQGGELPTAQALEAVAQHHGINGSPQNVARLRAGAGLPRAGRVPAWRLGAEAARALREQEQLGAEMIRNERLAELAGVAPPGLNEQPSGASFSFALDEGATRTRVVLRSRWETGRRFELARILGDRIVIPTAARLFPATRAYTYRQKMQRSFAAELLSPFEVVDEMMGGDYSAERQLDVARHFNVSDLTIRTLLVNHRRLEHEELDGEFDAAAA